MENGTSDANSLPKKKALEFLTRQKYFTSKYKADTSKAIH
jgi:hypothetical protein